MRVEGIGLRVETRKEKAKVKREEVKELNGVRGERRGDGLEAIKARIRELLAEICGLTPAFVSDDAKLDALGVDALDRCEICADLEYGYDVKLTDEECYGTGTVSELAETVMGKVIGEGER